MPPPLVLLAGPPDPLRDALAPHFAVAEAPADATAPPESAAAVVVNVIDVRAAARQTRLWRAELAGQPVPIVWVLPDASPAAVEAGLDAGADVCLGASVGPAVLVAQVRAAARQRAAAAKLAEQAADARALNDQLRRAYEQLDAGGRFADTVLRSLLPPRPPDFGAVRLAVASGAHGRGAGNAYHAARVGPHHVGVLVADLGTANLGVFAPLVRLAAAGSEWTADGPRVVPPAEVLTRVNRALVGLALDPPALVGVIYAVIDLRAGRVEAARGGLPPAVHVPADVEAAPSAWVGPAPFLGAFEAEFLAVGGDLRAGDRLILHTAGRDEYVIEAAAKYRDRSGQGFADPVAREGLAPFPGTLVVIERAGEPSLAPPCDPLIILIPITDHPPSRAMKKDIHPKYRPVVFMDHAANFSFLTSSTVQTDETVKWEDGNEYPLYRVEISSASHPFFTGKMKFVDAAGRVEKFQKKFQRGSYAVKKGAAAGAGDQTAAPAQGGDQK